MKLEIERQDFLKAWQNAEKLASTKGANELSAGVLITASNEGQATLQATDRNTSIRCKAQGANVIEPGTAVIPASMFGGMLRKLGSEDFVLEVNSERGLLSVGRNKMRFTVISAEEFPNIPESSAAETVCEISAPLLAKIIAEGSSAASQPQDFPKYLGSCLIRTNDGRIMAVSTDGKRLALSRTYCNVSSDEELLLPAQALKDFARNIAPLGEEKLVKILTDRTTVWLALEDLEYSVRCIDSAFPKFERILNDELRTTLRVNSGELISALERIDIIAKQTVGHIMAMSLNPNGELSITARAPNLGTAREVLQANIEGGELQLGFNVNYFMDGLKAFGGEEAVIEFSGEEGQTRMKREDSDGFLYMLMPARLSTQDAMTEEEIGDLTDTAADPAPQEGSPEGQNNTENSQPDAPF